MSASSRSSALRSLSNLLLNLPEEVSNYLHEIAIANGGINLEEFENTPAYDRYWEVYSRELKSLLAEI